MDPFSLIAMGVGTAGSLAGGIYNAASMPARKREFIQQERDRAREEYILSRKWYDEGFFPKGAIQAAARERGIQRAADQQFQIDPMSFVPFVQNATQLAGGIYDAATEPSAVQMDEEALSSRLDRAQRVSPFDDRRDYLRARGMR